jgi:AcrR family transcriptional regulator/DNA-binding MarR family transcriptional regulator
MLDGRTRSHRNGLGTATSLRAGSSWFAEAQRSRILKAAREIFCEHGYVETSVALIVARAGVSRKTFYDCFRSAEDCYAAVLDEALAEIALAVAPAYAGRGSWCERVRAGLGALLSYLDHEPAIASLLFLDAPGVPAKSVLERRTRALGTLSEAVEEGRSQARSGPPAPSLTAECVVGGACAVIQGRLREGRPRGLLALTSPLMGVIVLPYLGPAAAAREQERPPPAPAPPPRPTAPQRPRSAALASLNMRLTYRTLRTLEAIAAEPGASNRDVATAAEISDQGQISKLLGRLQALGLLRNTGEGADRGRSNAWCLTALGEELADAMRPASNGSRHPAGRGGAVSR